MEAGEWQGNGGTGDGGSVIWWLVRWVRGGARAGVLARACGRRAHRRRVMRRRRPNNGKSIASVMFLFIFSWEGALLKEAYFWDMVLREDVIWAVHACYVISTLYSIK